MHTIGDQILRVRSYIENLAARGQHLFESSEVSQDLRQSKEATKQALRRLCRSGIVAQPCRGYYVYLPPEYRAIGCLPPEQLVPELMERQGRSYYVWLLSAAQYYGAAHQKPQVFQVLVDRARRELHCGQVYVAFSVREEIEKHEPRVFNTPGGFINVASPERTAFDLVGHQDRAGGIDQVATVLSELKDHLDDEMMVEIAKLVPLTWAQRLGYLLSNFLDERKLRNLNAYVSRFANRPTSLVSGNSEYSGYLDDDWNLIVNTSLDLDT